MAGLGFRAASVADTQCCSMCVLALPFPIRSWQIVNGSGHAERIPVVLFIAFDGVRVQVRNAPQVGAHWEYPAIKGWESSKKHFGFKSENAITRREEHFKFDTHEVTV